MTLWIRTGNGGLDPDLFIKDLGIVVPSGAGFTLLLSWDGYGFYTGQFSPFELAGSEDLHNYIKSGELEASTDGLSNNLSSNDYGPLTPMMLAMASSRSPLDLSSGGLVLPQTNNFNTYLSPGLGSFSYNYSDGYAAIYDGYGWQTIGAGIQNPISFIYSNEAQRLAATGFSPVEVNRFALQEDDGSIWRLDTHSPINWIQVTSGSGISEELAIAYAVAL